MRRYVKHRYFVIELKTNVYSAISLSEYVEFVCSVVCTHSNWQNNMRFASTPVIKYKTWRCNEIRFKRWENTTLFPLFRSDHCC